MRESGHRHLYSGSLFDPLDPKTARRVQEFWLDRVDPPKRDTCLEDRPAPPPPPPFPAVPLSRVGAALTSLDLTETTVRFQRRLAARPSPGRVLPAISALVLRRYNVDRLRYMRAFQELEWHSQAKRYVTCCAAGIIVKHRPDERKRTERAILFRCKSRWCPFCARIRASQLSDGVHAVFQELQEPKFVTLTLRHDEHQDLAGRLAHLRRSFSRLRKHPFWKRRVRGGVSALEITHGNHGWHAHLHILCDARFLRHADLSDAWREASQGSFVVDVRRARCDAISGYISKYVTKAAAHLQDAELVEYLQATKGLRIINRFGSMYNDPRLVQAHRPKPEIPDGACYLADWTSEIVRATNRNRTAIRMIQHSAAWILSQEYAGKSLEDLCDRFARLDDDGAQIVEIATKARRVEKPPPGPPVVLNGRTPHRIHNLP